MARQFPFGRSKVERVPLARAFAQSFGIGSSLNLGPNATAAFPDEETMAQWSPFWLDPKGVRNKLRIVAEVLAYDPEWDDDLAVGLFPVEDFDPVAITRGPQVGETALIVGGDIEYHADEVNQLGYGYAISAEFDPPEFGLFVFNVSFSVEPVPTNYLLVTLEAV